MLMIKSVMIIVVDVQKLISFILSIQCVLSLCPPVRDILTTCVSNERSVDDDGGDEDQMVTERTGQKQEVAEQNPTSCLHCCGFLCVLIGRY